MLIAENSFSLSQYSVQLGSKKASFQQLIIIQRTSTHRIGTLIDDIVFQYKIKGSIEMPAAEINH